MSKEMVSWLKEQLTGTNEFTQKTLEVENKLAILFYLKSLIDAEMVQKAVIKPFFELTSEAHFGAYLTALPQQQKIESKEQVLLNMTKGQVLVVVKNELYLLDLGKSYSADLQQNNLEPTIHGSQLALSEALSTNVNAIRRHYYQTTLRVENHTIGEVDKLDVAILYDTEKVDLGVLEKVKEKFFSLNKQLILSSTHLADHLNQSRFALFPAFVTTERPDRIAYNLAGGKVIVMTEGNPQAVITPTNFFDFMTSMEDNYHTFWITQFVRVLRYLGLFTCILLPGLYVGITSFTPEVFRAELAFTVAGTRVGVPYPSFIEVLFLLFFMELLLEASVHLPKAISAAATTVGGLILGTAVTEAALASNIMVIIVSAVAISTFVIPLNEMGLAIRVIRVIILIFASLFGLAGVTLSFLAIILYLVNLDNFGQPYLRLYNYKKKTGKGSGGEQ